ncbi:MAG: FAD-binding oxidoreductase [Spirochaetes bacterium]|nr:FAD-binding oxidoreductase [Spirochaetota bacterium]
MPKLPEPWSSFHRRLLKKIPKDRVATDALTTFAKGTDAGFYRLTPKIVVAVKDEAELSFLVTLADSLRVPVTFRAAGTSLSGQAITDSVLVTLGTAWRRAEVAPDGSWIRLDPGLTGSQANRFLAPYGKKIGPDPASIDAAMIGGIAANNASGMCCGIVENSYHTLRSLRAVFTDGSVLDTGDESSRRVWAAGHGALLSGLRALMDEVRAPALAERLRNKYRIKNTTGYGLNALLDFDDPVDALAHLLIGSEGTLAFLSSITYRTVAEHPHKASALLLFRDMAAVCEAVVRLQGRSVSAAELLDRPALRSVEGKPGIPAMIEGLPEAAAALLVETRAPSEELLTSQIAELAGLLGGPSLLAPPAFTRVPAEYEAFWKIRKGVFPAVGAKRPTGTTVIIEDVAFPIERLAEGIARVQELMARHGYPDGVIFGHALAGNIHFVFSQSFGGPSEVARYAAFMEDVAALVLRLDGSLKAEHGTGRNMAPFVAREWGEDLYGIMGRLKALIDPRGILNPGVILSDDPEAHLKNLKPMPAAHELVDACIECGFCEPRCPSRHLTLTPRQRIASVREVARLQEIPAEAARFKELARAYVYQGIDTCAADGLCALACPVGIDTGKLTVALRQTEWSGLGRRVAASIAGNFAAVATVARLGTALAPGLPKAARVPKPRPHGDRAVYFPSCMARTLGAGSGDKAVSTPEAVLDLFERAGLEAVLPKNLPNLCCGKAFESKGFPAEGEAKHRELVEAIREATEDGRLPLLIDTSPCALHFPKETAPIAFLERILLPRLTLAPLEEPIAFHIPCSDRKMGLEPAWQRVAARLCAKPIFPVDTDCCAFAGDRGFLRPELNRSALRFLKEQLPADCGHGVSSSRGCEIGLTRHAGVPYRSIFDLVARCAR